MSIRSFKYLFLIYFGAFLLYSYNLKSQIRSSKASPEKASIGSIQELKNQIRSEYKKYKAMYATVVTNFGEFKIKLAHINAPITVKNFVDLAEGKRAWIDRSKARPEAVTRKYYDGLTFHRISPNFVIQGGDPKGDGTGGPGYYIPDEHHQLLKHDKKGVVSMANAGPGTTGGQFFILLRGSREGDQLDGFFNVFGQITDGMDTVDKIAKIPTLPNERPRQKISIKSITIQRIPR
ncbi:MAG: peptidylprolyl isomerase [Bdellovibrionales bacterium]